MKKLNIILTVFAALLLCVSCSKEQPAVVDPFDGLVAVDLCVPPSDWEVEAGTATKAALANNTTVRVVAFKTASGNPATANYVGEQTYYVKAGVLTPCTVDASGKFVAETTEKLMLPTGNCTLYANSPALQHNASYSVSVSNGVDFTSSITNATVTTSTSSVTLTQMAHKCARIKLKVMAGNSKFTKLQIGTAGVTIGGVENLKSVLLGGAISTSNSGSDTFTIPKTAFTASTATTLQCDDVYILPTKTSPLTVSCSIDYTYNSVAGSEVIYATISPSVSEFTGGNSYLVTLKVGN